MNAAENTNRSSGSSLPVFGKLDDTASQISKGSKLSSSFNKSS